LLAGTEESVLFTVFGPFCCCRLRTRGLRAGDGRPRPRAGCRVAFSLTARACSRC
jgi:hypothetical protein